MKRTRRIEIVRYSRRVSAVRDDRDTDETSAAEYVAAIGILSLRPGDDPLAPEQAAEDSGQAGYTQACAPRGRAWFWLDWLMRK